METPVRDDVVILSDKELARRGQRLLLTGLAVLAVAAVLALGLTVYSGVVTPTAGPLQISAGSGAEDAPPRPTNGDTRVQPTDSDAGGTSLRFRPVLQPGAAGAEPVAAPDGKISLPAGKAYEW